MFEIIRPKKDATIYGYIPKLNSGRDEIIELTTSSNDVRIDDSVSNPTLASRILLDFEDPGVDSFSKSGVEGSGLPNVFANFGTESRKVDFNSGTNVFADFGTESSEVGTNVFANFGIDLAPDRPEVETTEPEEREFEADVWLRLYFASGEGLPQDYELQAFPVEESWSEGLGRRNNDDEAPVNWIERRENTDWSSRGGSFDGTSEVSETFGINDSPDIFFKVNRLFNNADVGNGILLKRKEEDLNRFSRLSFFSKNTNTVFVPHLLVGRETFTYDVPENTEEFTNTENMSVFVTNLKDSYQKSSQVRFRVRVRKKFQKREFLGIRPSERRERREDPTPEPFLPQRTLFYEIRDARTGESIHPFSDPYTALSYDAEGHFFDIDLSNLFPKRPYEILFKFVDPDTGNEQLFAPEQTFEVLSD